MLLVSNTKTKSQHLTAEFVTWFLYYTGHPHLKPEASSFCHLAGCLSKPSFLSPQSGNRCHSKARSRFVPRLSISTIWLPPSLPSFSGHERRSLLQCCQGRYWIDLSGQKSPKFPNQICTHVMIIRMISSFN